MSVSSSWPAGGVYRVSAAARRRARALEQRARARGFAVFVLNLAEAESKAALLRCAAEALDFPDYFGANWDAFYDCVTDFGWRPAPGYLLHLQQPQRLARRSAPTLSTALQVLAQAAEYWRGQQVPFLVLVDDPQLPAFSRGMRSL